MLSFCPQCFGLDDQPRRDWEVWRPPPVSQSHWAEHWPQARTHPVGAARCSRPPQLRDDHAQGVPRSFWFPSAFKSHTHTTLYWVCGSIVSKETARMPWLRMALSEKGHQQTLSMQTRHKPSTACSCAPLAPGLKESLLWDQVCLAHFYMPVPRLRAQHTPSWHF